MNKKMIKNNIATNKVTEKIIASRTDWVFKKRTRADIRTGETETEWA